MHPGDECGVMVLVEGEGEGPFYSGYSLPRVPGPRCDVDRI